MSKAHYPLVICYIAIENGPFLFDLPQKKITGWDNISLVGGIPTPLNNMMEFVSWDDEIPN